MDGKFVEMAVLGPTLTNLVPDYLSLLETRYVLKLMRQCSSSLHRAVLLIIDLALTGITGVVGLSFGLTTAVGLVRYHTLEVGPFLGFDNLLYLLSYGPLRFPDERFEFVVLWSPCLFTSIWLWLYAGSGFLLKAARRFDIGFEWFNKHFDIEKKPLQSIGLVAGVLVGLVYWAAAVVSRAI